LRNKRNFIISNSLFLKKELAGFEEDTQVQKKGPVFYVVKVVLEFFLAIHYGTAVPEFYLCPTGKAGTD